MGQTKVEVVASDGSLTNYLFGAIVLLGVVKVGGLLAIARQSTSPSRGAL